MVNKKQQRPQKKRRPVNLPVPGKSETSGVNWAKCIGPLGMLSVILAVVAWFNLGYTSSQAKLVDRDPGIDRTMPQWHAMFKQVQPQIVFVGNSMLRCAVDERSFTRLTGIPALRFTLDGSASAGWYLMFKNVILTAPVKPKVVAFFFRDHFLTEPDHRVAGEYKRFLDQYAGGDEPILDRLAYLDHMDNATYCLNRYSPLYRDKDKIKSNLEDSAKKIATSFLSRGDIDQVNGAIERVFDEKKMDKSQLTRQQLEADSVGSPKKYDFPGKVKHSFLPHIIQLAKDNDIDLVFVRVKRLRDTQENGQPEELVQYVKDLRTYLDSNGLQLIDFSNDKRIEKKHFDAGDHLSKIEGNPLFTKLLAKKLGPIATKLMKAK